MGLQEKINANPTVYAVGAPASKKFEVFDDQDEDSPEPFEPEEVFGAEPHASTTHEELPSTQLTWCVCVLW